MNITAEVNFVPFNVSRMSFVSCLVLVLGFICIAAENEVCECKFNEELNLKELLCVNKSLSSFPDIKDIECLPKIIDLSLNNMYHVENDTFSQFTLVNIIIMYRDGIRIIDDSTFDELHDLKEIDLSSNLLDHVQPDMFVKNTKLEKVSLSNNPLIRTSTNTPLLKSPSITTLELYGCHLESISKEMFSNMGSLKHLNLAGNNLKSIPYDTFTGMYSLTLVEINNNEWSCDCRFQDLREFVATLKAKDPVRKTFRRSRPVRCFTDNGKGMKTVTEASRLLDCDDTAKYCSSKDCELPTSEKYIMTPSTEAYIKESSVNMDCIDDNEGCTPEDCLTIQYSTPYQILFGGGFLIVIVSVLFFIVKCYTRGLCCSTRSYGPVPKHGSNQYDHNILVTEERNMKDRSMFSSKHRLISTSSTSDDVNQTSPIAVYSGEPALVFQYPIRPVVHVYERINTNIPADYQPSTVSGT